MNGQACRRAGSRSNTGSTAPSRQSADDRSQSRSKGRFAEAESIARADQPAEEAAANVAYLKQLLHGRQTARRDADNVPVSAKRLD